MLICGGDPQSPFPFPHCACPRFSVIMVESLRETYLRLEMRLKDCSTLQSIPSRRQREQAAAGVWTMSHRSYAVKTLYQHAGGGRMYRKGPRWANWKRVRNMHVAHLLLLTLIAGLSASTSALACDRRGLLHLARFRAPLRELNPRGWPGQSGGPKVARGNQRWPIRCQ